MTCLNDSGSINSAASKDHGDYCYTSVDSYSFTTPVARASQVFAILVLVLLCLAANGLMIYAVLSTRSRAAAISVSSMLLINLATADLLVGTLVLPLWVVSTATLSWPLPEWLCSLTAFLTVTLMVCSILSLSAIAVDRYLNLAYPFRYPTEVTPQRLAIVLAVIWAVCFLVAGLPLVGWGLYTFQPQTVPICNPSWAHEVGFSIFLCLFGLTAPFFVMLVAYVRIVQIAKRHIAKIEATQAAAVGSLQVTGDRYDSLRRPGNSFAENTGALQSARVESTCSVQIATVENERIVQTIGNEGGDVVQNGNIDGRKSVAQNISQGSIAVQNLKQEEREVIQSTNTRTKGVVNGLNKIVDVKASRAVQNTNVGPTSASAVQNTNVGPTSASAVHNTNVGPTSASAVQNTNVKAAGKDRSTKVMKKPLSVYQNTNEVSVHKAGSANARATSDVQNTDAGAMNKHPSAQPNRFSARPLLAEHGTTVEVNHATPKTARNTGGQPDDNNNSSPIITISYIDQGKNFTDIKDGADAVTSDGTILVNGHRNTNENFEYHTNSTELGRVRVTSVKADTVITGHSHISQHHLSLSPRSIRKQTSETIRSGVTAGSSSSCSPMTMSTTPLVVPGNPSGVSAVTESCPAAVSYLSPTVVTPPLSKKQRSSRSFSNAGPISKRVFSKSVKTANRVFVAVGVFFLCWGPYVLLNFWSVNNEHEPVPYSADLLTTLLAFANSAVNPVLFLVINRDYRRRVRALGQKCRLPCLHRKHATLTEVRRRRGSGGVFVTELDDNIPRRSGYYSERTDRQDRINCCDNERSEFNNNNSNIRTSDCYLGHTETPDRDDSRSCRSRSGTLSGVIPVLKQAW